MGCACSSNNAGKGKGSGKGGRKDPASRDKRDRSGGGGRAHAASSPKERSGPGRKTRSNSLTGRALFQRETSTVNEVMVQLHVGQNIRKVYEGLESTSRRRRGENDNWLGAGNFGSVRVVTRRDDGHQFACKILRLSGKMSEHRRSELLAEILLLAKMDHPHIAKLFETYEEEGLNLYLVMELLKGGELFKRLTVDSKTGHFSEAEARHVSQQMVSAVAYLHDKGIVHRDLKLENFVYREKGGSELVLIDFGLSVKYNGGELAGNSGGGGGAAPKKHLTDLVGSSYYIAPEVMRKDYGMECDMWSIGVIVFMLLSGTPPFKGQTERDIMASAMKGVYSMNRPVWKTVSRAARDFVRQCLVKDVRTRITSKQALEHRWLVGGDSHNFVDEGAGGMEDVDAILRADARRGSNNSAAAGDVFSLSSSGSHGSAAGAGALLDEGMFRNLVDYSKLAEFKRIALQAVAYSLSYDEVKELGLAFERLDADMDGYISFKELQLELQSHRNLTNTQCKEIFDSLDFDRTGKIHYNEFVAAVLDESHYHDETVIQHAFDKLDLDHDGIIDVGQLKRMFHHDGAASQAKIKLAGVGAASSDADNAAADAAHVHAILEDHAAGLEEQDKLTPKQFLALMRNTHMERLSSVGSASGRTTPVSGAGSGAGAGAASDAGAALAGPGPGPAAGQVSTVDTTEFFDLADDQFFDAERRTSASDFQSLLPGGGHYPAEGPPPLLAEATVTLDDDDDDDGMEAALDAEEGHTAAASPPAASPPAHPPAIA